jgi:hypothetical protein
LSFPVYIIAESDLPSFTKTLLGVENYKLSKNRDGNILEIVRGKNRLKVAIYPSVDFKGYFIVKSRSKIRFLSSSKELQELFQTALSNSNAVPFEDFEGWSNRK